MAMALLTRQALDLRTAQERWQSELNNLQGGCLIMPRSQVIIFQSQTAATNNGNRLLSLPVDLLLEILEFAGPLMMYNVILTCKTLGRFVCSQPTLLYPNLRETTSLSQFESRWDFVRGCFPDQLLPLYVTSFYSRVPLIRRVHYPRVSNIHVRTGCYRCDLTNGSPFFAEHEIGSKPWLEHLRQELARLNTPCTRGIAIFVAMEFALWFGELIANNGGTPRPRRNLSEARKELLLQQSRERFRVWIRELHYRIRFIIFGP